MKRILTSIFALLLLTNFCFAETTNTQEQLKQEIKTLKVKIQATQDAIKEAYPAWRETIDKGSKALLITGVAVALASLGALILADRNPVFAKMYNAVAGDFGVTLGFFGGGIVATKGAIATILYELTDSDIEKLEDELEQLQLNLNIAERALETSVEDL